MLAGDWLWMMRQLPREGLVHVHYQPVYFRDKDEENARTFFHVRVLPQL